MNEEFKAWWEVNIYKDVHHKTITHLRDEAFEMATPQWQQIETAPKDGTEIIGWDGKNQVMLKWQEFAECWAHHAITYHPTHWQPKPKTPLDQMTSACCGKPVEIESSKEGTHFYKCTACGNACDA